MHFYMTCDVCNSDAYTAENFFVEARTPRPSDPSDLCCIMAGHLDCFGGSIGGSINTPAGWNEYIESPEAYAAGYLFLT